MKTQRGISLLEVSLAVSVGLMLTIGGAYAYRQHAKNVRVTQAKMMLETMRLEIGRDRVLKNRPPTLAELKTNSFDGGKRGYYGAPGSPLRDPLYPPFDSAQSSPIRDLATAANPTAPFGGWRYSATNGDLKPNFNPADFPGHDANSW